MWPHPDVGTQLIWAYSAIQKLFEAASAAGFEHRQYPTPGKSETSLWEMAMSCDIDDSRATLLYSECLAPSWQRRGKGDMSHVTR